MGERCYATLAYDARGNTTTMATEALTYDGANRHVQAVKGTTTVRYVRDAGHRIVERKVNGAVVARYATAPRATRAMPPSTAWPRSWRPPSR